MRAETDAPPRTLAPSIRPERWDYLITFPTGERYRYTSPLLVYTFI